MGFIVSSGEMTYPNPGFANGKRLDWCYRDAQDCGQPAADAWCKTKGYNRAVHFIKAVDIGVSSPTQVISTGTVCNQSYCDGFSSITCGP